MRREEIVLVDDVDGATEDVVTRRYAVDGVEYEIDLAPHNAASFDEDMAGWMIRSRKVGRGGGAVRRSPRSSAGSGEAARIRSWARENGHDVPDRGRISGTVLEAYRAAHGG